MPVFGYIPVFWVHTSISLYAIYISLPLAKLLYTKKKKCNLNRMLFAYVCYSYSMAARELLSTQIIIYSGTPL